MLRNGIFLTGLEQRKGKNMTGSGTKTDRVSEPKTTQGQAKRPKSKVRPLTVKTIRRLMRYLRGTVPLTKNRRRILDQIERAAKQHIKRMDQKKFRGKYAERFPEVARGITESFYTTDEELAD